MDWYHVKTVVYLTTLDNNDQIVEKIVNFKNNKDGRIKWKNAVYYNDSTSFDGWILLKNTLYDFDMYNEDNVKSRTNTLWNCEFESVIQRCVENEPDMYQQIIWDMSRDEETKKKEMSELLYKLTK